MKITSHIRKWGLLSICAAVIGVGVGAGGMKVARQYFVQGPSATQIVLLPGGNVLNSSDIARFDTRTGAVYRFRGDTTNPSVRNTWELRVAPVKEKTSGILEIQRIIAPHGELGRNPATTEVELVPSTFLVDVVTGDTWILRRRASTNATWDKVELFKHSDWGSY
ncbi:MAG: hypothetical protein ACYS15_15705 [Planctomycetota bacterium]|jgi:hypothetical protein